MPPSRKAPGGETGSGLKMLLATLVFVSTLVFMMSGNPAEDGGAASLLEQEQQRILKAYMAKATVHTVPFDVSSSHDASDSAAPTPPRNLMKTVETEELPKIIDQTRKSAGSIPGASATRSPTEGSEHWQAKRKFIGSEPVDGDWLLNCPIVPPAGYPRAYPIMDIVTNWSPDRSTPLPQKHYHALCRFDYRRDLEKAMAYREAEVPFVVYNVPAAEEVVRKWRDPKYLEKLLGSERYRTEVRPLVGTVRKPHRAEATPDTLAFLRGRRRNRGR